jgi:hypothetical protein
MIASAVLADSNSSTAGRFMPTTAIEAILYAAAQRPQPGFTDWNTLADDGFGSVRHPCNGGPERSFMI